MNFKLHQPGLDFGGEVYMVNDGDKYCLVLNNTDQATLVSGEKVKETDLTGFRYGTFFISGNKIYYHHHRARIANLFEEELIIEANVFDIITCNNTDGSYITVKSINYNFDVIIRLYKNGNSIKNPIEFHQGYLKFNYNGDFFGNLAVSMDYSNKFKFMKLDFDSGTIKIKESIGNVVFLGILFVSSNRVAIIKEEIGIKYAFSIDLFNIDEELNVDFICSSRHEGKFLKALSSRNDKLFVLTDSSLIEVCGTDSKLLQMPKEYGTLKTGCLNLDGTVVGVCTNTGILEIDV